MLGKLGLEKNPLDLETNLSDVQKPAKTGNKGRRQIVYVSTVNVSVVNISTASNILKTLLYYYYLLLLLLLLLLLSNPNIPV